jgi:hypothetical protein
MKYVAAFRLGIVDHLILSIRLSLPCGLCTIYSVFILRTSTWLYQPARYRRLKYIQSKHVESSPVHHSATAGLNISLICGQ